jgi:hypothetical protein
MVIAQLLSAITLSIGGSQMVDCIGPINFQLSKMWDIVNVDGKPIRALPKKKTISGAKEAGKSIVVKGESIAESGT